jgi:hypothetical protein
MSFDNHKQFVLAIHKLYPNVNHTVGTEAYDDNGNIIEYDVDLVTAEIESNLYKHQRANEYPPITDYLDGIVKGDEEQVQAYIDKCLEIKAKYPKGE